MPAAIYTVAMSFATGILIGLTSIGGAALMTPFLILVVGMKPDVAVGTDLVYSMFTKVLASWLHWKQGHVDLPLVRRLASASLPGAALGTLVMIMLLDRGIKGDHNLNAVIGTVLLIVALVSLLPRRKSGSEVGSRTTILTFTYAGIAGFFVGLTSIGSGTLMLPFLISVNRLRLVRAVGTDIFHAAFLTAFTALLHASTGRVQWRTVCWLLLGSLPGIVIGSRLAPRLPEVALRVAVLGILFLSAFKLIMRV